MILEIFVLLLCIAGFLCIFGYYSKIRAFAVVGMTIIFLLSSWIVLYSSSGKDPVGLQYRTGSNVTTINSSLTVTSYTYTTYNDNTTFWVGFLLAIIAALGVLLVAVNDK